MSLHQTAFSHSHLPVIVGDSRVGMAEGFLHPMNQHRGSDFNQFLIEQGLTNTDQPMTPTPTPRTDAAEILWNDTGWCVVSAEFARYLELELAAERALADRLADALENAVSWRYAKPAFDAWREARHGTR